MFRLLLIISLIHQGNAIQCAETTATINSVCDGDLCYQVGSGASRGCISGMKYLNEGCHYAKVVEFFVCLCRSDFCNLYLLDASASKSVSNVVWGNRSFPITIYPSINCNSNSLNAISNISGQFCASNGVLKTTSAYSAVLSDETSFADGLFGIHPPAFLTSAPTPFYFGGYYIFQTNSKESFVYQLCNWDVCNENGYTPSTSTNLRCFMSDVTNGETCQGQYCFIQINKSDNSTTFGCFTQDDSKAMGRVEVGVYQFDDNVYYFCAGNDCNINLTTAIDSIAKNQPSLEPFKPFIPQIRSTTQPVITSTIESSIGSTETPKSTTEQSSIGTKEPTSIVTGKSTADSQTTEKPKTTKGEVTEAQSTATIKLTTDSQTTVTQPATVGTVQPITATIANTVTSQPVTDQQTTSKSTIELSQATKTTKGVTEASTQTIKTTTDLSQATVTSEKAAKTTKGVTETSTETIKTTKGVTETSTETIKTTKSEKTTTETPKTKAEKTTKKEKTTTTTTTMATTTTAGPTLIDELLATPYIPVLAIITVLCIIVALFNLVFYLVTKRLPFCSD